MTEAQPPTTEDLDALLEQAVAEGPPEADLLGDLPLPDQRQEAPPNPMPVKIHMKNGKTFIVEKVFGWVYEELGVFATGNIKGYSGEIDVLIPYDNVDYYELDFPALKRHLEKQQAAEQIVVPGS